MDMNAFSLLAAATGGFFGAAIGGLHAFVFTGFVVLLGLVVMMGDPQSTFLLDLAFGPAFGPHVSFAGGVAAAAYAARKGLIDGKDIVTPLAKFARPDVLLVGALFGAAGYVIQKLLTLIPWFGSNTDSVALTVVISAVAVRLMFGKVGLFARGKQGRSGFAGYAPDADGRWIEGQERFVPNSVLGIFVGALAAFITLSIVVAFPTSSGYAHVFPFGLSAVSLALLSIGHGIPVTHHITLPAGLAAVTFLPLVGGNTAIALIIGALAGLLGAWAAELFSRLWLAHGDTHIDPPAAAIWPATTVVLSAAALVS